MYKRKRSYRRPYRRRTRRYGKRRFARRPAGFRSSYSGANIKIRRSLSPASIAGAITGTPLVPSNPISGINLFRLNDVPGVTDFTSLFSEYCIAGVKLTFHLRRSVQTSNDSGTTNNLCTWPTFYFAIQTDGGRLVPTSINEMLEHSNLQRRLLNPEKPFSVFIRPRIAPLEFSSSATTISYASAKGPQWISTIYGDVYHYGLKWLIDEFVNTNNYLDVTTTYYVKFRGAR